MANNAKDRLEVPAGLFQAVDCQRFGTATCFLCGRRLGSRNRSDEHVFPKWLQNRYELWNDSLVLLNGTPIQYRQLTIPCCLTCNTGPLSRLEDRVQTAIEKGLEAVEQLPRIDLMLWLGKILYGVLYKEGFLRRNRRRPKQGPIVTREMLDHFAMHHYFLQATRIPFEFVGSLPASIFLFRVQSPSNHRLQFDFRDLPPALAVSVRLGETGILAALQDGGAQLGYSSYLAEYQAVRLHPLQFIELTAKFFYKASLFDRVPKYLLADSSDRITVIQTPLGGLSRKPLFEEWSQQRYATILSFHTGFPLEHLYHPPDRVLSWLRDDSGQIPYFDFEAQPWPAYGLDDQIEAQLVLPPAISDGVV